MSNQNNKKKDKLTRMELRILGKAMNSYFPKRISLILNDEVYDYVPFGEISYEPGHFDTVIKGYIKLETEDNLLNLSTEQQKDLKKLLNNESTKFVIYLSPMLEYEEDEATFRITNCKGYLDIKLDGEMVYRNFKFKPEEYIEEYADDYEIINN